jgi:protein-arginine kinase
MSKMKTNDYVKYLTQTVVQYIDQPRDERKKLRQEKRDRKADFLYRWFGIVPYVLMLRYRERRDDQS